MDNRKRPSLQAKDIQHGGVALLLGGELYPAPTKLTAEEIDNVVAYLQARIIGKGEITKQECLLYYTEKPKWCDDYN